MYLLQVNLISGQNDFNLSRFVISLSLFMIMNTRDKEITDQPRLNHFDLKSNSTCNIWRILDFWLQFCEKKVRLIHGRLR